MCVLCSGVCLFPWCVLCGGMIGNFYILRFMLAWLTVFPEFVVWMHSILSLRSIPHAHVLACFPFVEDVFLFSLF